MANEKTLEILKEMKADPKAKELLEEIGREYVVENIVSVYAEIAEKLGYDITAEDVREAWALEEARRKAETDNAVADMVELDDDDLEHVAGGFYHIELDISGKKTKVEGCVWDFTADNCFMFDACEENKISYYGCEDKFTKGDYKD